MFEYIVSYIDLAIKTIGILVILRWFVAGVWQLLSCVFSRHHKKRAKDIHRIRWHMAGYILLGLDFIIAADIVASLINTDIMQIISLAIIVWIRVTISHFLAKELATVKK